MDRRHFIQTTVAISIARAVPAMAQPTKQMERPNNLSIWIELGTKLYIAGQAFAKATS